MKKTTHVSRAGLLGLMLISMATTACATNPPAAQTAATPQSVEQILEVHADGRINIFYDKHTYDEFLQLGETSFRLTRIGAGPKGETLVFGLPAADKKKTSGIPAIDIYEGKRTPANFYGEMRAEGRIFVFSSYADMKMVRDTGEAALRFSDIGSGPKGETVIYVLNKSNKKEKPTALMAQFRNFNGMN
ncbi:MAG: hypothetical protein RRB22_07760 [Gammaproteobacteria bacterium]|nr:hypothetical protein [Gammaproteobacteria bacterium]